MKIIKKIIHPLILVAGCLACSDPSRDMQASASETNAINHISSMTLDTATFGNGCFWCTEAIFESLNGVQSAVSGYSGGHVTDPDYNQVCSGTTGHAEAVQILYDPSIISFEQLLEVFWSTHDPTTLNRQGNDVGTQYRSVVFYHNEKQKELAESYKQDLNNKKVFPDPIVTEIVAYSKFYPAENYHQQYFELNGHEPYCTFVIRPKLDKFKKAFHDKLKTN